MNRIARPGLIPAHAGKTRLQVRVLSEARAHPRSRGENICPRCLTDRQEGSSPLTRGKHPVPLQPNQVAGGSSPLTRGKRNGRDGGSRRTGLIPAHAGKTGEGVGTHQGLWAHPRSRGENTAAGLPASGAGGSSPLTRGKRGTRAPS